MSVWKRFNTTIARSSKLTTFLAIGVLWYTISPRVTRATEFNSHEEYNVPRDTTVDDDIVVAAGSVRIGGKLNGDALAFTGSFNVTGEITGAAIAAAEKVTVSGRILHSLAAAGKSLYIEGDIGGSVYAFGGTVEIARGANLSRDLSAFCEDLTIRGNVSGDVVGGAKSVLIDGFVGGDVRVEAKSVEIQKGSVIEGDLRYTSKSTAIIDEGAVIKGSVIQVDPESLTESGVTPGDVLWKVYFFSANLITGLFLILVAKRHFGESARGIIVFPARAIGYGLVVFGGGIVVALMLLITVVGIPTAALIGAGLVLLLFFAKVFSAAAIGALIFGRELPNRYGAIFGRFCVGLIVISLLALIPYLGWIVCLGSAIVGAGGFALHVINSGRETSATSSPATPAATP